MRNREAGFAIAVLISTVCLSAKAEVTTLSGADYAARCQTLGVPLPPRWGETVAGRPTWVFNGTIPGSSVLIVPDIEAHVYYYANAQGTCMALPRYNPGTTSVGLFGVICQGTTGKVCFWDSNKPVSVSPTAPISMASTNAADLTSSPWIGGAALSTHNGGMCTDCHRGENPFIVMPGAATDLRSAGVAQFSNFWYEPVVPAKYGELNWFLNPGPGSPLAGISVPMGEQSCLDCHIQTNAGRLPTLGLLSNGQKPSYCTQVLQKARDLAQMPPPGKVFTTHNKAMDDACANGTAASPAIPTPPSPRDRLSVALIMAIVE